MTHKNANNPESDEGRQYHLETRPGDLAGRCLLVGSPERAEMIAETYFRDPEKVGDHRGLKSFTGIYKDVPVSVVTTGMGSASTAIVLPEAVKSGARVLIRVGSCGGLQKEMEVGDPVICTGAVRLDGASDNWAPIEYPAAADPRIVVALIKAATELKLKHAFHVGIGVTTTCFNEGQARPDPLSKDGYIPQRLLEQHQELTKRGVKFYSMEEATLFVWCSTHGGIPCGAIDAVYANRVTNEFATIGDETAATIALNALSDLKADDFISITDITH